MLKDRIREARKKAGLSQGQLAEMIGIAKSTLSGYESFGREPTVETLSKIMEILNVDANYLLQDEISSSNMALSDSEKELIYCYRSLNSSGKERVMEYIADISERYKKDSLYQKRQERQSM